jgi:hypothetical protein
MTRVIPFAQRFGAVNPKAPIDRDVPETARVGLIGILEGLIGSQYVAGWQPLAAEALHTSRKLRDQLDENLSDREVCVATIREMSWDRFYTFCERAYRRLQAISVYDPDTECSYETQSLEEAQAFYGNELNELLAEENLAYEFHEGFLQRRGRPQTQKALRRAGAILADARYRDVRIHYNKALGFFNRRPKPDEENCVKEAVCALEASVETLFGGKASKDFDGAIRSRQGNDEGQIPPTIADGLVKLRAFRGAARGVAHAALEGGPVGTADTELVLSLVAAYVTYLNDKFPVQEEELPF